MKTNSINTPFFGGILFFSCLQKSSPCLFITDSSIEAVGEFPFSPVLLHGERSSKSKSFSVYIFKFIEGKCQIILQNVVRPDLTLNCTVGRNRWAKKRGPFSMKSFFLSRDFYRKPLPPVPKDEAIPGKPHPAYWWEQSAVGTDILSDYGIIIGFENTLAQWQ